MSEHAGDPRRDLSDLFVGTPSTTGPINFMHTFLSPIACVLILLASASSQAVLLTGLLLVALLTIKLVARYRQSA